MDLAVELPGPHGVDGGGGVGSCRYRAVSKINCGSFGDILAAVNEADPADWVALKVQARFPPADTERRRTSHSMVRFEQLVCGELARAAGARGDAPGRGCPCPAVRGCVSLHGEHDVLGMELLGPNLREYAAVLGSWPLPEELTLVLGAALVGRLQQLHSAGFLHRDIKPDNLVLSLEEGPEEGPIPRVVLVDFALAMRFSGPGGDRHIENTGTEEVAGTHRYMAVHAQQGVTQSRRSDLESLAHVLIYLALAKLPWQNLQDKQEMCEFKKEVPVEELCKGLRPAFASFLNRCRALEFKEEPDYEGLQRLLLESVRGPIDFQAARVRADFRNELRESYLRHCQERSALAPVAPLQARASATISVFVRYDGRGELLRRPLSAAELDDGHSFCFEAFTEPLAGTRHVVVGKSHFFAYISAEAARLEGVQDSAGGGGGTLEKILAFSSGRRTWVTRAASVPEYEASASDSYEEWNLRSAFWARAFRPGEMRALRQPQSGT